MTQVFFIHCRSQNFSIDFTFNVEEGSQMTRMYLNASRILLSTNSDR